MIYNKFIMTQEDKEILLKDICARLPYGVKVLYLKDFGRKWYNLKVIDLDEDDAYISSNDTGKYTNVYAKIEDIKPHFFPLSSMTEEQQKEKEEILNSHNLMEPCYIELFDWYHQNHFDYRGLISKGLAIDCTNLNIY